MASNAILAAAGLVTSPNQLNTQEGSLSEASNVVIKRDGIIEQRRGFSTYGDNLPSSVNRAKQITSYRQRILRHYSSKLQFDSNGVGRFVDIDGTVVETETGLRIKFVESNGNLYFTTQNGIKKLSAKDSSDLALMSIETSGIEKALDIKASTKIVDNLQSGFLPQDSTVAYRVVWNKEDRNNNLITGAPSQRAIVTLPMSQLIIRDTMRLLQKLDELDNLDPSTARIDDGNYLQNLKLQLSSSPTELRSNLIALATKLDNDIILAKQSVSTPAPVRLTGGSIDNGVATITFEMVTAADLAALNALATKQTYIIYKALDTSKFYQWDGSVFIEKEILKDYFSSGLNIFISGFSLSVRDEKQTINFSSEPDSGNLTIKYKLSESAAIPYTASNADIKSAISKVDGLEYITNVTGSWATGFELTFSHFSGDLDQILVGPATTLKTDATFVTVETSTTQNGIAEIKGDLNGAQTVSLVSENTIKFNTTSIGVVTVATDAEIKYNEFRSIPNPVEPSIPALNIQLESIQVYFDTILQTLQNLPTSIVAEYELLKYATLSAFPPTGQIKKLYQATDTGVKYLWDGAAYVEGNDDKGNLDSIDLTTTANVQITFTIPENITIDDFYQVYRSSIAQATGTAILDDLSPNDEMQLVFEAYPTQDEITQKSITILDETPEIFRGANLYTNAATGEGALQTNDQPPFAKDINRYRNSIFYANTRTKHRLDLNMLPVENIVQNYDENDKPKITITNGTSTNTYSFVTGKNEIVKVVVNSTSVNGDSFKLFSARGLKYRIYFNTAPALDPDEIGVKVEIGTTPTLAEIAIALSDKLSTLLDDFSTTYDSASPETVFIDNVEVGEVENAVDVNTGFSISIEQEGRSSKIEGGTLDVLLSTQISIGQAVDETAKALVEAINKNENESIYAFYMSAAFDVPGKILLESRSLEDINPFYLVANNSITGASFNPDISPDLQITSITSSLGDTIITTNGDHNLMTGEEVILSSTNSTPSVDGIHTITKINNTQFLIEPSITINGNSGAMIKKSIAFVSENESKINRVYYSKFNQPEAVPILNYFDLGASDKRIIRILPLRDSLFVFKEDGLFRISGETAPFQSELFDNSFILLAPDSLDVCNNVIYGWTTQGIQALTEGGASVISRNIDNIILKTQSSNYINFKTATWGIGYESDNSYVLFTVKKMEDTVAQIAYRYSTITNTWTTYDKSFSCGHIADFDDHFYAGATDIPNIEKERKTFSRLDYADREYETTLSTGKIQNNKIILPIVSNFEVGDVLVQDQTITIYEFNQLLNKLDMDSGPSFSIKQGSINSNTASLQTVITSANHRLETGRLIKITGSNSTPSIDGEYSVNVIDLNSFSISKEVTIAGTKGSWLSIDNYFNELEMVQGDSPKNSLIALAVKLDLDTNIVANDFESSIESKAGSITFIESGSEAIITSANHGLLSGRIIQIIGSNSVQNIDGKHTVTVIDSDKFKIPLTVVTSGNTGTWQTLDSDFNDLKVCYNKVITMLNNDNGVNFSNYRLIDNNTIQETIITNIDRVKREITVNLNLPLIAGTATVFKAIKSSITYSPNTFSDPLNLKHLREATLMFETRTLTSGVLAFATDLLPEFIKIPFNLDGNGIFGHQQFGENFFGGLSNSAPFRTYIPRQCQRCRYIIGKFSHSIAREDWRLLGMTVTGEVQQSTRAFR